MSIGGPRAAALAELSPANFAIVMATGMVGIAARQQGFEWLAFFMLAASALAWVVVAVLALVRLHRHRARVFEDLCSHQRAPGFFTTVAGTSVLGSQLVVLGFGSGASTVLAAVAVLLWVLFTYGILMALTIRQDKPLLQEGISGAWLLTVVATQSIAVLMALLASHTVQPARLALNFTALSLWLVGGMVYIWVIALIFYRHVFFRFTPEDLTPPYWINMGAMAISALAGGLLVLNAAQAPFLQELMPVLKGGTVLYWAVGTWWIPLLAGLAVWRYVVRRHPMRYDPMYWGAVFPLGMYAAATHQMSHVLGLRFLSQLARGFFFLALLAWLITAIGLVRQLLRMAQASRLASRAAG